VLCQRNLLSAGFRRDERTPTGGYRIGRNPQGISDKTVWVIKFETMTGEPIAFFRNYALHGTVLDRNTLLTGELACTLGGCVEQMSMEMPVMKTWPNNLEVRR
jgi:neutral ceramidase